MDTIVTEKDRNIHVELQQNDLPKWKGGTQTDWRIRLLAEKKYATYDRLEMFYRVNRYYIYNVIKREEYILPAAVRKKLKITLNKPRHRRAINLDDPKSAADTIISAGVTDEYLEQLFETLQDEYYSRVCWK